MSQLNGKKQEMVEELMRNTIFDATIDVLDKKGIKGLTVRNVSKAAGVSVGTLYNYFNGKDDFLQNVGKKIMAAIKENILCIVDADDLSATEKLNELIHRYFSYFQKRKGMFQVLNKSGAVDWFQDNIASNHRMFEIKEVSKLIEQGIESKEFREVDTVKTSELILCTIFGKLKGDFFGGKSEPVENARQVIELFTIYLKLGNEAE